MTIRPYVDVDVDLRVILEYSLPHRNTGAEGLESSISPYHVS